MYILVIVLLALGAQCSLTAFAPADAGKAWLLWPFTSTSKPWLGLIGGLPQQSGSMVTPLLAGVAGLAFIAAALSLFGWLVPAHLWTPLVLAGAAASLLLFVFYAGPLSILPIAIDALLLWGVIAQHWSVSGLKGL